MTFYLAAPFPQIEMVRHIRDELVTLGHEVTSRWLDGISVHNAEWAMKDFDDIDRAERVVIFNDPDWIEHGTGGRHTELGYALGRGRDVILIGKRSQIFHYHPRVQVFPHIDAFFLYLESQ